MERVKLIFFLGRYLITLKTGTPNLLLVQCASIRYYDIVWLSYNLFIFVCRLLSSCST